MLAARRRRVPIRVLSMLLAFCAPFRRRRSPRRTNHLPRTPNEASGITFDCAGRTSEGKGPPSFASGGEAKFDGLRDLRRGRDRRVGRSGDKRGP